MSSFILRDNLRFTQATIHSHDAKSYNNLVEKDMCVYYAFYLLQKFIQKSSDFKPWRILAVLDGGK